jgi:hypothetical protein
MFCRALRRDFSSRSGMTSRRAARITAMPACIDPARNLSLCRGFGLKRTPTAHCRRRTTEQGRQGQNIRGMLPVLFGLIALAVVGFAAIYVLNQRPQTPAAASTPATTTPLAGSIDCASR